MKAIRQFKIKNKVIGGNNPAFVIAEAGINHNGDIKLAFRLIKEAKKSLADCVKFQTFSTKYCESKYSLKPKYFRGQDKGLNKIEFSKSLEFDRYQFLDLKQFCDQEKIIFLSMAADIPSLELLVKIGVEAVKIGSSDTLNFPLFKAIGQTGLPVIYSTGISTFDDVRRGVKYLYKCSVKKLAVLQCTSAYPPAYEDINLKVIQAYQKIFKVPVGLSDHSLGLHISYAAVAIGSEIIEKHFTLDKKLPGVDHGASLEPREFREMVQGIRQIESALGDGKKRIEHSEKEHLLSMRKSLFTLKDIKHGEKFNLNSIGSKRPGGGVSPAEIDYFLGRRAKFDIPADEFIKRNMVEK